MSAVETRSATGAADTRDRTGPVSAGRPGRGDTLGTALPLLLPAFAVYAVFSLAPIVWTVWLSVTDSRGLNTTAAFVGLANYERAVLDPIVAQSLVHTFQWLAGHLVLAGGLGLVLALLIGRLRRTRVFFRTALFLPHLVSLAVVGVIWANIYDPFYGLLNTAVSGLGLGWLSQGWLSDPLLVLFSVNVASSWQGFGLYMLLFLAGLQNIDRSLYEAAEMDGANGWQQLWYVTLPGLSEVMTFVVSLCLINGLKGFATVFVMTGGGPFYQSELITTYIYRLAFSMQDHGLAAVLCILLSALAIMITVAFNKWRQRTAQ
jgi:raffinose/stachyose/melibiose transport system permease protein